MVGILTNLAVGYWLPATGDVYQRITCQDSESLNIIVGSLRESGKPRWPLGNVGCGLMFLSWSANLWGTARLQSADGRRQPFVFVAADLNPELNNTAARMPANFHDQRRKEYL